MEKDLKDLTKEELLNPSFIPSIFDSYTDEVERQHVLTEILDVAKQHRVGSKVQNAINKQTNLTKVVNNNVFALLLYNNNGLPEPSTENIANIMRSDPHVCDLFAYDEFARNFVNLHNHPYTLWSDADDSELRHYIETNYQIYNQPKYLDAFNVVGRERSFHPIKQIIEKGKWDKKPRIDRFLTDILGCDDSDYHREVSRMIFYGGISRLYRPGCKFDYMPIFVGKQSAGKSTIIDWLALDNKYYRDVYTIEGKDGMEVLDGAWICEMAELLAMVRNKDVEAMKSYVTRTTDKYRKSYDRRISEQPRQCIFIGTTNDSQFLVDKTGNRRYLPVEIKIKPGEIFKHEKYVKDYILKCWREALYLYDKGDIYLHIPDKYADVVAEMQASVLEDDPKVGLILDYLSKKEIGDKVCGLEIFTQGLNGLKKNYNQFEGKEISKIMQAQTNWIKSTKPMRFPEYGVQRFWEKMDKPIDTNVMLKEQKKDWDDLD